MNGVIKDCGVVFKGVLGPVAMMHIKINNTHAADPPFFLEVFCRNGNIIKETEPHGHIHLGMMPSLSQDVTTEEKAVLAQAALQAHRGKLHAELACFLADLKEDQAVVTEARSATYAIKDLLLWQENAHRRDQVALGQALATQYMLKNFPKGPDTQNTLPS